MIDPNTIAELIEIGKSDYLDHPDSLNEFSHRQDINLIIRSDWYRVTEPLPVEDLVALIKAITLAESRFRWAGGSVAAVIWIFRRLQDTDLHASEDTADWILSRTQNPYLPFGTDNCGARSLAGYRKALESRAKRHSEYLAEERARQEQAKRRRQEKRQAHLERIECQATESRVRRQFLAEFMLLDPSDRLRKIAKDTSHPVDYYPPECAMSDPAALQRLPLDSRRLLIDRLKDRRKGPWSGLCRLLQDLDQVSS